MAGMRPVRRPILLGIGALLVLLLGCTVREPAMTAYARELREVEEALAQMGQSADRLQSVRLRYLKTSLTGDFSDLRVLEREIEDAISELGPVKDLILAKANTELKLHRLDAAAQTLERFPMLKETTGGRSLLADIALQRGHYEEARVRLEAAVDERPGWEELARLAYYRAMTGERTEADRLYARAQGLLTAKEMRHYAWLELQRGIIDLEADDVEAAFSHYRQANRAYSGHWLIEEHMAEALALLGRSQESEVIYARVVSSTNKPELLAAYARVVARRDPQRAVDLTRLAHATFDRQMTQYPQAAVGHYLGFLMDSQRDRGDLIALATMNFDARPNADAKLLLAWAYLKAGRVAEARFLIAGVEASPWRPRELAELKSRLDKLDS